MRGDRRYLRLYVEICVYIKGAVGSVFFDYYSANCVRYINIDINSFPVLK